MKNIIRICATLFAAIIAASCAKEVAPSNENKDVVLVPYSINASIDDSKANISGLEVLWQAGDKIAVFDGTGKREFTLTSGAGTKSAYFNGMIDIAATKISAVAPYSAAGDEAGKYTIPTNQTLTSSTTIDPAAVIMVAAEVAKSSALAFTNPCGVVRMTVPAGTCEVYFGVKGFNASVAMGTITTAPKTIDVVIPADDHKDVFVGVLTETESLAKTSEKVLSVAAGSVVNLGDVTGTPATFIKYASDLDEFLKSPSKKDAYFLNDVSCLGSEFVDTATIKGVFDGRGHSIKKWTSVGKALIASNKGTVKNITIDGSCTLKLVESSNSAFGFLVKDNSKNVSGCVNNASIVFNGNIGKGKNLGTLVGYSGVAGSQISDCVNNGNITIEGQAHTEASLYLGGVIGKTNGKTFIKNCVNTGNITYITTNSSAANTYIAGVVGATTGGGSTEGCENSGNICFKPSTGGAGVILAGINAYTSGAVKQCTNTGSVKYLSGSSIKGTLLGGVVAYTSAAVSDCENSGEVVVLGTSHEGRNGIGTYSGDGVKGQSSSTVAVIVGGVVGGGAPVDSLRTSHSMTNCKNTGNVSYTLSAAGKNTTKPYTTGRHCVGGLVGDCAGPISNSSNEGDVSAQMLGDSFTASSAGFTMYIGGIAGCDYYSRMQSKLNITNCSNSGNVYLKSVNKHTTNHTIGGIVGWPGKEDSSCSSITKGCTNTGNVTVEGNIVCRAGGIQGGSGRIEECNNSGTITCSSSTTSAVGGIAGFHSGGFQLKACTNSGNVISTVKASGISGLIGNAGNAAMTIGEDSEIHCNITAPSGSTEVGMLIGKFNGNSKITVGTSGKEVHVKGNLIIGGVTTPVTGLDQLHGTANYSSTKHIFNFVVDE